MKILAIDLIPRHRRRVRRVEACVRSWLLVGGLFASLLFVTTLMVVLSTGQSQADDERGASGMAAQIITAKQKLADARAELVDISRRLAATDKVRGHPDWSVLLRLLASKRGEGLAIAAIELQPADASPPLAREARSTLAARPTTYTLRLTGLGKDHTEVAQFALRLEQTGLFTQVVLQDTVAKKLAAGPAVSFGIECEIRDDQVFAGAEK